MVTCFVLSSGNQKRVEVIGITFVMNLLWTLSNDQADLVMKSETKITLHDETASFIGEQLFNMKHAMENQSA